MENKYEIYIDLEKGEVEISIKITKEGLKTLLRRLEK